MIFGVCAARRGLTCFGHTPHPREGLPSGTPHNDNSDDDDDNDVVVVVVVGVVVVVVDED